MRVLFAGGGTGGHLFPGILLARELSRRGGEARFLVSGRAVEDSFFEKDPFPRATLALEPKGGGAPGKLSLAARLPMAMLRASREIRRYQPDLVVGIGGFVSLPAGLAAWGRCPIDLLEINSVPGKATRALRPFARRIYCGFEGTLRRVGKKGVLTGSPVRPEIGTIAKSEAREKLGLSQDRPVLLVMGGSQGAKSLNELVLRALPQLATRGIQLVHLTGAGEHGRIDPGFRQSGVRGACLPFLKEMPLALAAADLAVSRGGAATVHELAAAGLPSIIVPYPLHKDWHQGWNGKELGDGALVIEQKEMMSLGIEQAALPLLESPARLAAMGAALRRSSKYRPESDIVDSILRPV